ncbi:hypothetical protein ADUPG1_004832, partial [Aduncisulcus paluster]
MSGIYSRSEPVVEVQTDTLDATDIHVESQTPNLSEIIRVETHISESQHDDPVIIDDDNPHTRNAPLETCQQQTLTVNQTTPPQTTQDQDGPTHTRDIPTETGQQTPTMNSQRITPNPRMGDGDLRDKIRAASTSEEIFIVLEEIKKEAKRRMQEQTATRARNQPDTTELIIPQRIES